jgi:ribosomal 30S subunit maturation factor RimM
MNTTRTTHRNRRSPADCGQTDDVTDHDIIGYDVLATDGTVGKVHQASSIAAAGYLVIDTRRWIFGAKYIVPAALVTYIDHAQGKVFVHGSKDELKAHARL